MYIYIYIYIYVIIPCIGRHPKSINCLQHIAIGEL